MKVAVVMPAWNEGQGVVEFVSELDHALSTWERRFIIVDDCSTDDSAERLRQLETRGIVVDVHTNPANLGHGPSTCAALRLGLASGADVILAVDGDGQFVGDDVARVAQALLDDDADVVEGVRSGRGDPSYRRIVSGATRILVWTRVGQTPADANTPLRAYRPAALARLLRAVPPDAVTPNLIISALCRRWPVSVVELPVASMPRRAGSPAGGTWGSSRTSLPSRRFVAFCYRAGREWLARPVRYEGQPGPARGPDGDLT